MKNISIKSQITYLNGIVILFYYAPLHIAVEEGSIEIVKLLLSMPQININLQTIFSFFIF